MRDSALKLDSELRGPFRSHRRRRRAHARQRFETLITFAMMTSTNLVGEELMRDSALKRFAVAKSTSAAASGRRRAHARQRFETASRASMAATSAASEKSSCATAL